MGDYPSFPFFIGGQLSFIPIFWNTETQQNLENKTSKIYGSHVAYKKQGHDWTSISSSVETDLSVTKFAGNVQFPTTAQGWMDICFNSEYSAKRQIAEGNWNNSEDEFNMRMRTDTPTNSVGIIHPDKPWQVIYYNAFGQGVNLIYGVWRGKQCRVEHVIEITEMPSGDSEYLAYDFYIQSTDATAFIGGDYNQRPWDGNTGDIATVQGFDVFLAKGDDFNTPRGSVLRTPACWWTNLDGTMTKKDVKIDFEIQPDGITVKATKYVKRSDIAEALAQGSVYRADATFSPDASPETSTVDGYTQRQDNSFPEWETLIEGVGTAFADNTASQSGPHATAWTGTNIFYQLRRCWIGFDTSSIGADQTVDSATLQMKKYNHNNSSTLWDSELLNIYAAVPATADELDASDHQNMGTTAFATGKDWGTIRAQSQGDSTTWTLNTDGKAAVDTEGLTQIGIAWEADRDGTSVPTAYVNYQFGGNFYMAEQTGTSSDPLLTVTHSEASSTTPFAYYYLQQRQR